MTSTYPSAIAAVDVAVVDDDLLWRVEHMNAVVGPNVRDFVALDDAVSSLSPGQPAVLLLGPNASIAAEGVGASTLAPSGVGVRLAAGLGERGRSLELIAAAVAHDERIGVVLVVESPTPELGARAAAVGIAVVDAACPPAEVASAVRAELARRTPVDDPSPAGARTMAGLRERDGSGGPGFPHTLVVVTSAKGGEGVTTVAANLAASLAGLAGHDQRRVVLMEGDPHFGDLGLLLHLDGPSPDDGELPASYGVGARSRRSSFGRGELVDEAAGGDGRGGAGQVALAAARSPGGLADLARIVEHPGSGLGVALPPLRPIHARASSADLLLDMLGSLGATADVVVVDAPLDLVAEAGLGQLADVVLVVTTLRMTSLKNTMLAAQALDLDERLALVVNEAGRHHREPDLPEIERATGLPVLARLPYDVRLDRAGAEVRPTVLAEHRSPFAKAMVTLVGRVTARTPILS